MRSRLDSIKFIIGENYMKALNFLKDKWRFLIAFVVRRLHRRMMTCENCGNDKPYGLPVECGYKDDFKRISGKNENELYCSLWSKD